MIVTKYALEIVIDEDAWKSNYGGTDSEFALAKDVQDSMASIVVELVNDWIDKSGNAGAVRKIYRQ